MALDANLYTLQYQLPTAADPELVIKDNTGSARYTCTRSSNDLPEELNLLFLDSLSQAELGSLKLLKGRMALITLNNPSAAVELASSSRLSWAWSFEWEEVKYTWKRDTTPSGRVTGYTLYVSRKPDADFPVCLWRAPSKAIESCMQMLDYNLHRLDVQDRIGLDILMCFSICKFLDWSPTEQHQQPTPQLTSSPKESPSPDNSPIISAASGSSSTIPKAQLRSSSGTSRSPPGPPVQPTRRGSEGATNEVRVLDSLSPSFLIEHCLELFKDRDCVFIELQASTASQANKAIHVAQEVKRQHAKVSKQELFQYVKDRSRPSKHQQSQAFDVASSLTIYLSRIPLDELAPKPPKKDKPPSRPQKLKLFGL